MMRHLFRRARPSGRVIFAVLGVAVTLGAVGGSATAAPDDDDVRKRADGAPAPIADPVPAGFRSWDEVWAVQEELTLAADRITAEAGAREIANAGLGSIVVDTEQREVRVYWKGELPAPVDAVIADAGVDVDVLPAHYSAEELQQAADSIIADGTPNARGTAPLVSAVGPLADASGLRVSVDGPASAAFNLTSVRQSGVAVQVDAGVATHPATRANDSEAYWGGAVFQTNLGSCTSGFAITHGGQTSMLTAGHCALDGQGLQVFDGGGMTSANFMGYVSQNKLPGAKVGICCFGNHAWEGTDIMRISMTKTTGGAIYTGALVDNVDTATPVVGISNNYVGHFACTSGAPSGRRCNLKITGVNENVYVMQYGDGHAIYGKHNVRAEHQLGHAAVGQGDSGGPVIAYNASTLTAARAKGIIAHQANQVACVGPTTNGDGTPRWCGSTVFFVDINKALSLYGAQLKTS